MAINGYAFSDIYGPGFGGAVSTTEESIPEATEREHYGEAEGFSPGTTTKKPQIFTAIMVMIAFIILLHL